MIILWMFLGITAVGVAFVAVYDYIEALVHDSHKHIATLRDRKEV